MTIYDAFLLAPEAEPDDTITLAGGSLRLVSWRENTWEVAHDGETIGTLVYLNGRKWAWYGEP